MTELELIIDLHKNSERQGPGSEKDTLMALSFMNLAPDQNYQVADIGCGSGGQTITLVQNIKGHITALDLIPEFLDELNEKASKHGLTDQIITMEKSMDDLPFEKDSLDIIWSEGAIYNIGFENGVKEWKSYLKSGGYLAVSEITWITNSRPKELENFWNGEYLEMDTAANKIKILEENGFTIVGYFFLSPDSWIENYYKPMEARFDTFLARNNHSESAQKLVEEHRQEIDLFMKYKNYYSYGFYVAKKDN